MARRLEVWLNRVSLREVDARIIIDTIADSAPEMDIEYGEYAGRAGQRMLSRRRAQRVISVEFRIRELFDLAERQRILDAVNAWAADGWLETNVQDGKRIYVHATGWPGVASPRNYNESFTVDFTASDVPYWESLHPASTTITAGATGSGTIRNGGSIAAPAELVAVVQSGTLTSLTVGVGATNIALTGLSVAAGGEVRLTHDETGTLSITAGGVGALSARTASSDDELLCAPGPNSIGYTANTSVALTVTVRGRYR